MMCKDIYELASDYQDHTLPFHKRVQVWMHLRLCDACRAFLAQLIATRSALRKVGEAGLSQGEEAELLALLQ